MAIRLADPSDAGTVARLLTIFNGEFDAWAPPLDVLERRFEGLLDRDDMLVVLAGGRRTVGFALVTLRPSPYYEGPVASLDEMYVLPEQRGQGWGGQMMARILHTVRDRRCGEVQINVDELDHDTRRFYESHGFRNHDPETSERMLCYCLDL